MNTVRKINPFDTTIPALESVTDKYAFIPTSAPDAALKAIGYTEARRGQPKRGLGLHFIDYTHPILERPELAGIGIGLRMYNAHNGTAAFQFRVTLLNGICLNILEPGDKVNLSVRVIHRGYADAKVKLALSKIERHVDGIVARVQRLQETKVDGESLALFCREASKLRDVLPWTSLSLAEVRHEAQAENTAWNVFNRVQEALIRGEYPIVNEQGYITSARAVNNIRQTAIINRKLWNLAEQILLKG